MSIAEKLTQIAENEQKVYDAGKKAEYDAFWDVAQSNGTRTNYSNGFAGGCWRDDNFKPKYPIVPSGSADRMFYATGITDLTACIERAVINFDLGNANRTDQMFYYATNLLRVPIMDVRNVTYAQGINSMFQQCQKLHTIEKLILPEDGHITANNSAFNQCYALENITIEGVIGTSGWNFSSSTKLTKASITSIINALSTTTSGLTVTLSGTAVINAFGSTSADEWKTLIAPKIAPNGGWTISLQ